MLAPRRSRRMFFMYRTTGLNCSFGGISETWVTYGLYIFFIHTDGLIHSPRQREFHGSNGHAVCSNINKRVGDLIRAEVHVLGARRFCRKAPGNASILIWIKIRLLAGSIFGLVHIPAVSAWEAALLLSIAD